MIVQIEASVEVSPVRAGFGDVRQEIGAVVYQTVKERTTTKVTIITVAVACVVAVVPVAGQGDRLYSGAATHLGGLLDPAEEGVTPRRSGAPQGVFGITPSSAGSSSPPR